MQALAGAEFRVLHACGAPRLRGAARAARPDAGQLRPARVHHAVRGGARWPRDLCVARAGGSIFEIAAHGRPAILVPYPHAAADHQSSNARWMAQAGAAVVVADAELTPSGWRSEVRALLADRARLEAMGARRRRWRGRRRSRIADEVLPPRAERAVAARAVTAPSASAAMTISAVGRARQRGGRRAHRVHGGRRRLRGERLAAPLRSPAMADGDPGPARLHLIGLGGAGMSGYARVATQLGAAVSGSDRADSAGLRAAGRARGRGPRRPRRRERARRATASRSCTRRRSRTTTPSAPRRASAGCPTARAPSCSRELSALKRTIAVAGRARQDHDDVDGRARAAALRPRARLPHRRGADARPGSTPTGGRGSGSWSRPTSRTARCSRCTSTWPS